MSIPRELLSYKKPLHAYLLRFLKARQFNEIGPWGPDATKRISQFVTAGKGIRGSLALFSYQAFSKQKNITPALPLAGGLELIHAGFLIHDDIMDHDDLRRGKPSMHVQVGESVAICMGDLSCILGYESFSKLPILSYISKELSKVTIAQMHDVSSSGDPLIEDILRLYRFKTARYTFSLPLASGAMLAGANATTITQLEALGEHMGILFQVRDDELDNNIPAVLINPEKIKKQHAKTSQDIIEKLRVPSETKQTFLDLLLFVQTRTL